MTVIKGGFPKSLADEISDHTRTLYMNQLARNVSPEPQTLTTAMLKAGVRVLCDRGLLNCEFSPNAVAYRTVQMIYEAMEKARESQG